MNRNADRSPAVRMRKVLATAVLAATSITQATAAMPENFKTENLISWCVVPFDAAKRGPAERAEMLVELGMRRSAYDWRAEHVDTFEEEILEYQKTGIEYFAFWKDHPAAFELFRKYDMKPQIWQMIPISDEQQSQAERVEYAVAGLTELARKTQEMGCKLALYNHGGWAGEPENMVAVARALREKLDSEHVGIVYNFHHGHDHIADFAQSFALMKPYLLCLNLNGMREPQAENYRKILPIGEGTHEQEMIRTILESGYSGPIGIIDHQEEVDSKVALRANIEGLKQVLQAIQKADAP